MSLLFNSLVSSRRLCGGAGVGVSLPSRGLEMRLVEGKFLRVAKPRTYTLQGHNRDRYQGASPRRESNENQIIHPLSPLESNRIAKKTQHKRQEGSGIREIIATQYLTILVTEGLLQRLEFRSPVELNNNILYWRK